MNLDLDLVKQAQAALGTATATETVHRALEEAIRRDRIERLLAFDFARMTNEEIEEWSGGE